MAEPELDDVTKAQMGRKVYWIAGVVALFVVMLGIFAIGLNVTRPTPAPAAFSGEVPEPPTPTPTADPAEDLLAAAGTALVDAGYDEIEVVAGEVEGGVIVTGQALDTERDEILGLVADVEGVTLAVDRLTVIVTSDDEPAEDESADEAETDEAEAGEVEPADPADVEAALADAGLTGVEVAVDDEGGVELTGFVADTEERNQAGEIAAGVDGVTSVSNLLGLEALVEPTVADLLTGDPELSTLTSLVDPAVLETEEGITVFAPTNQAFAAVTLPEDQETIDAVLAYHLVSGPTLAADLADGATLTTLQGEEIVVTIDDDGQVVLNGTAVVVRADLVGSDGVVHVIDAVLIPPSTS